MKSTFTIIGNLRWEAKVFKSVSGDRIGQLELRADIEYQGQRHSDVIFLLLEIGGSMDTDWWVNDQFPAFLPYLKPVKAFRQYLIDQLQAILLQLPEASQQSPFCPLWMGIGTYIAMLENFNETRSLIAQLKQEVERLLRDNKRNEGVSEEAMLKKLQEVFEVLGVEPKTEQLFEVR